MGKKIAIISVLLLLLILSVLGYYLQQGKKRLLTDPYKAVSQEACIVIETVDIQSFMNSLTTGKGLFGELGNIREFRRFNTGIKFLADQLNKPDYKEIMEGGKALLSFYPGTDGRLYPMLAINVPGNVRYRHMKELLNSSGINDVTGSKAGGIYLLKVPYSLEDKSDTVFFSISSGLLVCSSSRKITESAVAQMAKGEDVRSLPGFARVHLASGKREDKIFVIFSNLTNLMPQFFSEGRQDIAKQITNLAGTAEGDIYINENGLVLSGYTGSEDSSEVLSKYKYITPEELNSYRILPSGTVFFETMILPPEETGSLSGNEVPGDAKKIAGKIRSYTGNELTRALIDMKDQPPEGNMIVILGLNNRIRAEQIFLEELGPRPGTFYFRPDDQINIPVYKVSLKGFTSFFKQGFEPGFDETFFAFYDNYLITGNSYNTISRLLYDNMLNKTISNDVIYKDFESTLTSRAGYFFYCVPSRMINYLSGFLSGNIIEALKSNKSSLSKIQSAGYQLAASNEMIYNSLSVRFKENVIEESTTEWETLLDTVAAIKPFFFTNHITGAREIFMQDLKNNIYLINAAGRVLWKVPLSERINGTVYMIDYYRNGKYQLLFSGKNYIHLIDRNGNYVERYPVKLRSPATNSLAIFDYDNNMNYRLFIAGEDRMIYSYDKSGSVVKGWNPYRTAGKVRSEICYFKVSGKDYIVASDEKSVYFLDRKGNKRLDLKEVVTRAGGSAMRLISGSEPSVVCSSPDGTVQQIFFDGRVRKLLFKEFSFDHSFDIFDVNGDGFGEYIFIDSGKVYLYNRNKAELFSRDFGTSNLGGPINFIFSGTDRKIGVIDIDRNLIYLIDKDGKTIEGFPLRGASMFSIGKLSEKSGWHLIVGGTDRFLYNYKIETGN